jgi:hypothetical protein
MGRRRAVAKALESVGGKLEAFVIRAVVPRPNVRDETTAPAVFRSIEPEALPA